MGSISTVVVIRGFFSEMDNGDPYMMCKFKPRYRTITLTKLLIKHAKFTQKETEIGV